MLAALMAQFRLHWEAPSDVQGGLEKLCKLRTAATVISGLSLGALGYGVSLRLGVPQAELVGGLAGISVSGGVYHLFSNAINVIHGQQQEALDRDLQEMGAPVARFSYQGDSVACVLRPEYQATGKVFEFEGVGPLREVTFEYHPREIRFRFKVPLSHPYEELGSFIDAQREEVQRQGFVWVAMNQVTPLSNSCTGDLLCVFSYRGESIEAPLPRFCDLASKLLLDVRLDDRRQVAVAHDLLGHRLKEKLVLLHCLLHEMRDRDHGVPPSMLADFVDFQNVTIITECLNNI